MSLPEKDFENAFLMYIYVYTTMLICYFIIKHKTNKRSYMCSYNAKSQKGLFEINKFIVIVGNFNNHFSIISGTTRQKISRYKKKTQQHYQTVRSNQH